MRIKFTLIMFSLFAFFIANAQEEKKENPFSIKWDNGFKVQSADKDFQFKFGGRVMLDYAFFSHNDEMDQNWGPLNITNATEFRRARLYFSGLVYGNVEFKLQLDFAGGVTSFKDVYIGLKDIPGVGTIRVGHVKEPFRLEALTSSKYITFMERSLSIEASQERNNGVLLFNEFAENRIGAQIGLFRNSNSVGNNKVANNSYALTGRVTGIPYQNVEKKQYSQVGIGVSNRQNNDHLFQYEARPETHLGEKYISTGVINDVDKINLLNLEAVYTAGPLSFQGEYMFTNLNMKDVAPVDSYKFNSSYAQVSYFFTGESRKMESSYDGFGRVKPNKNFGKDKGLGAWEVALRYSDADFNDQDIMGGEQQDITLGLNWYLNPVTRVMLNNVFANINDFGKVNVFEVRFQIDF